ncbi:SAGA-associated factor 29 [Neolecta irregularis DAH-3]|uniref:SAGA-associated factor 29 n=1 Tax=Neolecta irregularis (strain DAH-3) TaxID=1198029 RepID=A0A1U7LRW4_NEOID|nr:SAGA-associated factor 29 [Neolecta irregularis DAH-3]|eukprot:OLL25369.1 SAGA-associated factor 29 [Neolecta irregularis DAH-3]
MSFEIEKINEGLESQHLPLLRPGTTVLARYPETTTFYRAEFIGMKRDGVSCRLRFEGEEEAGKETEVERRLVIEAPTRG